MQLNETQVKKLLSRENNIKFNQLGFSLLVTRLSGLYSKDPNNELLKKSLAEINAFITQYKAILSKDFDLLAKL